MYVCECVFLPSTVNSAPRVGEAKYTSILSEIQRRREEMKKERKWGRKENVLVKASKVKSEGGEVHVDFVWDSKAQEKREKIQEETLENKKKKM